jgi:hypothetical protein
MRALSHADCLSLWERGQTLHPLDQGLLAVHVAFPESQRESVADWPLGRRNRALAQLRCACFGRWLRGWTACKQCGDKLEFEVDGNALMTSGTASADTSIDVHGKIFRVPTSRDLAHIAGEHDPALAAIHLLEQCLVSTPASEQDSGENGFDGRKWTAEELDAIGERMAQADPLSEVLLHFDCPACNYSFDLDLDLPTFLWSEMEGRAKRLLRDVHTLASAYGWSESEILSLSPARRDFYLEMVRA